MKLEQRVKLVKPGDFTWNWENSYPTFSDKTPGVKHGGHIKFDPFPCYHHDRNLVIETAKTVEALFPIGFDVFYFIYPYESMERTNGTASTNTITYGDKANGKKETWEGVVNLYGKRIPPMPAMTKYLGSHEYAHLVDNWICNRRGLDYNGLDKEYAKMRGIKYDSKYGGKKWHTNVGEIIANDFRIAVCNIEPEFWPHDCKHPYKDNNAGKWWAEAHKKFSKKTI